jgi:hypothetical protein
MNQLLLASALIALPVAGFTVVELVLPSTLAATSSESLGDLSALEAIVADTQTIANSGDLVAAETRITAFETKWDDGEAAMRPEAPNGRATSMQRPMTPFLRFARASPIRLQ